MQTVLVPEVQTVLVPEVWSTRDLAAWTKAGVEQQGMHEHQWYRHAEESRTWLFKPARQERRRGIGEDVVEKIASELARSFGIPAARVAFAANGPTRGVLIEDVRPTGWVLQHGKVLMSGANEAYDPENQENRGHSAVAIKAALRDYSTPPAFDLPRDFVAFDVFAGYLVFDALIAHGDRHDRNWAVLEPPPGSDAANALCASFDHAASLGFQLSKEDAAQHLRDGSVGRWACRGRARRFEHFRGTPWQSLVALAGDASRLCRDEVRTYWRGRVLSVDRDSVREIVSLAPDVADVALEFVIELVMVNRERLLNELD